MKRVPQRSCDMTDMKYPLPPPLPPKPNKLGGEYGVEGGVMKCVKVSLITTSKNKSNFDDNVGERLVSISFICWHFW